MQLAIPSLQATTAKYLHLRPEATVHEQNDDLHRLALSVGLIGLEQQQLVGHPGFGCSERVDIFLQQ
jgi:hypothetical protein